MSRFTKRQRVFALAIVAVLVTAGGAVAYWTGAGSGSGTGTVGTNGSVVLTGSVASGIAPGTSEPVTFTAANAGTSPIQVSNVHLVSMTPDSGHADCLTGDFSMADVPQDQQVPAGATSESLANGGSLVYANTDISQDACKGATLTLTLSSS
jgi:hypothetical protein